MKKILVIGELCRDVFVYGTAKRLAPEAPVPVFIPSYTNINDGMAGNCFYNVLNVCSALFQDEVIVEFANQFNLTEEKQLIEKTRFVDEASNHHFLRVDNNDKVCLCKEKKLKEILDRKYDLIVISEYGKGLINGRIVELITESGVPVFLDTKMQLGAWSRNVFCVKINQKEFEQQHERPFFNCRNLIVTIGKEGALHYCGLVAKSYPTEPLNTKDTSGLGDVFNACVSSYWLKTGSLDESIKFANRACLISAKNKGVYVPTVEEIKSIL